MGSAQSGSMVFQDTVTVSSSDVNTFFFVDTSTASIQVAPGTLFTIGITPRAAFDLGVEMNDPYPKGGFYFNNSIEQSPDMAFRTYISTVPEPSSLIMLGLGTLVLLSRLWRLRATTA